MLEILTGTYSCWAPPDGFAEIELDLGCGKGGFLLELAENYPDKLIIGADIMLGRLRKVKKKVDRRNLKNVRLLRVSAWPLIAYHLSDHSLHRIHILCPDPWPKARHRSKRLLTSEFLGRLAGKLTANGILHISTDDSEYFDFIEAAISPLACYSRDPSGIDDVKTIKTDFENDFEGKGIPVRHTVFRVLK